MATKPRTEERLSNYLRVHRRRSGLTQAELEWLLGASGGSVSLHERFENSPVLDTAISYEIVFRTPVSEIFAGRRDALAREIEARLAEMEEQLGRRDAREPRGRVIARKLMWLSERRGSDYDPTT